MAFVTSKTSGAATNAINMYTLITTLIAAGWTCRRWGDGIASEGILSLGLTSGLTGALGLDNTRAYVVLRAPSGTEEYTIQRTANAEIYRIKRSHTGFSAGSPTFNTTPSGGADERVLIGSGTDAAPAGDSIFSLVSTTSRHWCRADSAAPYGFWAGMFPIGGGNPGHAFVRDPVLPAVPGTDGDPVVNHIAGSGAFQSATLAGSDTTTATFGNIVGVAPGAQVTWPVGTTTHGGGPIAPGTSGPLADGSDPLYVLTYRRRAAAANPGDKGKSTMMAWVGPSRSTGIYHDVGGTRTRVTLGSISLPWDGSDEPI